MVALPLALTAEYEPPMEAGDFAHVLIYLNGQLLLSIVSDDPVADTHGRVQHAVRIAIRKALRDLFRNDDQVEVP